MTNTNNSPTAGWYPMAGMPGYQGYWDGVQWIGDPVPMPPQVQSSPPALNSQVSQKPQATYVRQQQGHSLTKHILLAFIGVGFVTIPVISLSKNHYWHA